jgi:hypothetical protein
VLTCAPSHREKRFPENSGFGIRKGVYFANN